MKIGMTSISSIRLVAQIFAGGSKIPATPYMHRVNPSGARRSEIDPRKFGLELGTAPMLFRLGLVLSLAASCDVDCEDEDLMKMTLLQMSFTMPREIPRTPRSFFRD